MQVFPNSSNRGAPGQISRVAVVGTGFVGATTAYALLISGTAAEIILVDRHPERAEGHVNDLKDAALFSHNTHVIAGDFSDCADADVIIVTAGVTQAGLTSRLENLNECAAILKNIVEQIVRYHPRGVLLIASNPVDVLTYAVWKWSGLPASRVIGSGTSLDSSRFRRRLGEKYSVAPENVHAYIIGEHGDSQVAVLSSARIAGVPIREFYGDDGLACDDVALQHIANETRLAGLEIIHAKGATYYGIGAALVRIVGAILRDEHAVITLSSVVPAGMNLGEVCLSLPVILNRGGVARVLPIPLSPSERQALEKSADILKQYIAMITDLNCLCDN